MPGIPSIQTHRLELRAFTPADAPGVQRLAGDRAIADTTLNIPHPYLDGMAEQWIATHAQLFDLGQAAVFAVTLRQTGQLVGAIGLTIKAHHARAEMGYWIGQPFWNRGFGTEAARALLQFGFDTLGLQRIHASHLTRNPASGRVMQKIGMRLEGVLRQHVCKWDVHEDLAVYGILRDEFLHASA
jgi:RimJ/RimL family protein N-acetyltransferase